MYDVIFSRFDGPSVSLSWVSGFFVSFVALEGILNYCIIENDDEQNAKSINQMSKEQSFKNFVKDKEYNLSSLEKFRGNYAHGRIERFGDYKCACNISFVIDIREAIISALRYFQESQESKTS